MFGKNVRQVFQELFEDPLKELSEYLSGIETDHSADRVRVLASPDSDIDRKAIESALTANLHDLKTSFDKFLSRCKQDFIPACQKRAGFTLVSDEHVSQLLRRLAHDILPNIVPDGTLSRSVGFYVRRSRWRQSSPARAAHAPAKAPEGWRSPKRFALFVSRRQTLRVLECGGPPPLFCNTRCERRKIKRGTSATVG